jgi:hypothetical protein
MDVPLVVAGAMCGGVALVVFLITPWWLDAMERRGRLALNKQQMRRSLQFRAILGLIASLAVIATAFLADR